ncbi:MAG TPA: MaoC family dehydratase N-terminal domain-containing protein [Streptosporangiaceae bacterium]|nr:MaoC family dehydratase N-terminal domain-containing protein [Streptosporangiaceae bacterium]
MTRAAEAPAGAEAEAAIRAAAERVKAAGESPPRAARDPVNLPMIRNWTEALGDDNPVYEDPAAAVAAGHGGVVAPPAMVQVWTMPGLRPAAASEDDPLGLMTQALDEAGFTSVVATNCEQVYHRYLRPGEELTVRGRLEDVTGPKRTALGEGWFVTTRSTWYAGGEAVASMLFRVLKFRPGGAAGAGDVLRPVVSRDTEFFWAGTAAGELRIQRCDQCGALRHPPGPMCPRCGGDRPGYVVAAGTGAVYSYVVHRHPPVPGRTLPVVIALVALDEGVRMVGELVGADPGQVRIGLPVRVEFQRVDDQLTLPAWRSADTVPPARPSAPASRSAGGEAAWERLPELAIEVTPTFVISTALATRDFYEVHHDRDKAVARGSQDIFLNILTTTGLVQRYVTDWAGPRALVRAVSIRLGAPCYAGDTLTFSGQASEAEPTEGESVVRVTGRCGLGDHVTGTVRLAEGWA